MIKRKNSAERGFFRTGSIKYRVKIFVYFFSATSQNWFEVVSGKQFLLNKMQTANLKFHDILNFQGHSSSNPFKQKKGPEDLYRVVIIDNDINTYQEVMDICMEALGISREEAFHIAVSVDNNGRAEVLHGSYAEAEYTAQIIRKIGIEVQVSKI